MGYEYSRFECRVCGEQVFVPVGSPALKEALQNKQTVELTCPKGHTDSYAVSDLEKMPAPSSKLPKTRRAVAGIG